jgi:hypothetical protein
MGFSIGDKVRLTYKGGDKPVHVILTGKHKDTFYGEEQNGWDWELAPDSPNMWDSNSTGWDHEQSFELVENKPKFEVGDKVRVISPNRYGKYVGEEFTITKNDGWGTYNKDHYFYGFENSTSGLKLGFWGHELELAPTVTHRFKVGDRIGHEGGTIYTVLGLDPKQSEKYKVTWPTGFPTSWVVPADVTLYDSTVSRVVQSEEKPVTVLSQLDRIERKLDYLMARGYGRRMDADGKFVATTPHTDRLSTDI